MATTWTRLGRGLMCGMAGAALAMSASTASAQSIDAQILRSGFSQPLYVCTPPALPQGQFDDRMFVVEQTGLIRIMHLANNSLEGAPYLNVSGLISSGGELGLLGMVFHPDFRNNFKFYINYTSGLNTVIAEYTASDDMANTVAGPGNILLTFPQDFSNHNAGCLQFGPDGMLYVATGDGGSANDPNQRAQNLNSRLGKILRLDVDAGSPYIPADNPFVGIAGDDYIWSYGQRNPWRFSFDRLTGDMFIGDVGQDAREEVSFEPANMLGSMPGDAGYQGGQNYGWRCFEGNVTNITTGDCSPLPTGTVFPILEYTHAEPNIASVNGGYVYRGTAIPELQGWYLYSEFGAGWIRGLRQENGVVVEEQDFTPQTGAIPAIVSFGEDTEGELYAVSIGGSIFKIVSDDVGCGCECVLTGCNLEVFSDDFETDQGWTTSINGASSGAWERGVPIDDIDWIHDPLADGDGSGSCYLTQNAPGNTDVDGGSVTLTSPEFAADAGGITICYSYYLKMTDVTTDRMQVEISSSGTSGPWQTIVNHTTDGGLSWRHVAFTEADLTGLGVSLTSTMAMRFTVNDDEPQSLTEAGIDGFVVWTSNVPFQDCNGNCIDDAIEIAAGDVQDCNSNGVPDSCDIADGTSEDCEGGVLGVQMAGDTLLNTFCFGCHNTDGSSGAAFTGPAIRGRSRTFISNRITPPTDHPGGSFGFLTTQDFADLEAFLSDDGSRGRPDGTPDECQGTLPDCDQNGVSDGCELEDNNPLVVDMDFDGVIDDCPVPFGTIQMRLVVSDGEALASNDEGPLTIADAATGVELYLQARIDGDATATGLTTFDGFLTDDLSGAFAPGALTNTEAIGAPVPGIDFQGRAGMFPSYRSTIGPDNSDAGNGFLDGNLYRILPLNITAVGNGEGLNGNWANIYKLNWTSGDPTERTVTITADANLGGYQAASGLREPAPIAADTFELTIGASCPCERNGTEPVDVLDLLDFLSDWFAQSGSSVPPGTGADFDGSGDVDVLDLLEYLACWFPASGTGTCP